MWTFTVRFKSLNNIEGDLFSRDSNDLCDKLSAGSVEQSDAITLSMATNDGKMVSFGALEKDLPKRNCRIDVIPLRHFCYCTPR